MKRKINLLLITIILILSFVLVFVLCDNREKECVDNDIVLENKSLSAFTANKKSVDPYMEEFEIIKQYFEITMRVFRNGNVAFSIDLDSDDYLKYDNLVQDVSELAISKNELSYINGFDKKVVDVEMGCNGQEFNGVYVVFLMEDGSLEYSTIKNLITKTSVEGKIDGVSGIVRLHRALAGVSTVMALDSDNNLYDIGYMLRSKTDIMN